jgi:hypothetical protein
MTMKKFRAFRPFIYLSIFMILSSNSTTKKSTDKFPVLNIYQQIIDDIEHYDAEAIYTRNKYKQIKWTQYKEIFRKKMFDCDDNLDCFYKQIDSFYAGVVNLHSRIYIPNIHKSIKLDSTLTSSKFFSFDYPGLKVYDTSNMKSVEYINDRKLSKVFFDFSNFQCKYSSNIGCLSSFIQKLNNGSLAFLSQNNSVRYDDKSFGYFEINRVKKASDSLKVQRIEAYNKLLNDWSVVYKSDQLMLYKNKQNFILKIFHFDYESLGGNLACTTETAKGTLCYDIQQLKKILTSKDVINNLIVDVQNNPGGSEISSFLYLFLEKPFLDNVISFKKNKAIEINDVRKGMFYSSGELETWYQSYKNTNDYSKIKDGNFLKPVADFCRGSNACSLTPISSCNCLKVKNYIIVTNYNCVSSCDDFVWRMKKFSDASVIGQPQAADVTFSRIRLVYYLSQGILSAKVYGMDQPVNRKDLLLTMTVPASRSLDYDFKPLQGRGVNLNKVISINKQDFKNIEIATLNKFLVSKYIDLN